VTSDMSKRTQVLIPIRCSGCGQKYPGGPSGYGSKYRAEIRAREIGGTDEKAVGGAEVVRLAALVHATATSRDRPRAGRTLTPSLCRKCLSR